MRPSLSRFFHFHAVFGKNFKTIGWHTPLWEILNPPLNSDRIKPVVSPGADRRGEAGAARAPQVQTGDQEPGVQSHQHLQTGEVPHQPTDVSTTSRCELICKGGLVLTNQQM